MKMTISVGRCLKRKAMLVWVKEYIIKNFATCKSLCNLQELYTAFKEKHPNVNIGFSKFCALRPKWCVLAGSKMTHSVCVCSAHQNVVLLFDAMDWDLTYKKPEQEYRLQHWEQQMHHASVWILSWHCNSERISWSGEREDDQKFNYCQWTLRIKQYWHPLQLLTKNTKILWLTLLMI